MTNNGTGVYKMDVDEKRKVFTAFGEGYFTMEKGRAFTEDFVKTAKKISSADYVLIVDVKGVKPSSPEVAEALGKVLELYVNTPFKKRFITKLDSAIAQVQVERLGKSIPNFKSIIFVNSKEDALKQL